jgi:UDP-N-acetylglucosamine acyltransferase
MLLTSSDNRPSIHPTAVVAPGAIVGSDTSIGPYTVIGEGVRIGHGNQIGSHVVIEGRTTIGDFNAIYQFASIGANPQELAYPGEDAILAIGNGNIIREYVTIQPGTDAGGGRTVVGNGNLFMACSHTGHDCIIGNGVRLGNSAALAGNAEVGDGATLSGLSGVHEFVRIGRLAFVSAGAMVSQDVPPFCLVQGDRAHLVSLDLTGLQRNGMPAAEIASLKRAFRALFQGKGTLAERLASVSGRACEFPSAKELAAFVASSKRGSVSIRRPLASATGLRLA